MKEEQSMARELPRYTIEGTAFIVDVPLNELREADAPHNRIPMGELLWEMDGSLGFAYDLKMKNIAPAIIDPEDLPDHIKLVSIPPLLDLDPVGWARKYGLPDDTFTKNKPSLSTSHNMHKQVTTQQTLHRKKGKGI